MRSANFLTVAQAALILGIEPDAVLQMVDRKRLAAYIVRDGEHKYHAWRFKRTDLERAKRSGLLENAPGGRGGKGPGNGVDYQNAIRRATNGK